MGYCPNRVIGLDLGNKSNNKSKESSAISFASLTHCGKILKAPRQKSKPRHSKAVPTMDQPTVGDIPSWQKSFNLAVQLYGFIGLRILLLSSLTLTCCFANRVDDLG